MPVIVKLFQQYDPQLKDSLEKIYKNEPYCPQLNETPAQSIETILADPHCTLAGAGFNGKLIGAAILKQLNDAEMQLQHFCIRELTRRRGAGRQFIKGLIANPALQHTQKLSCEIDPANIAATQFALQVGFTQSPTAQHTFTLNLS